MFGGDPFGNPFEHMRRQMHDMDNLMNDMMTDSFNMFAPRHQQNPMITNGHQRNQQRHQNQVAQNNMMLNPFGGFGFGGGLFGGIMQQMEQMQNHAMNDPHSTMISQSTMISYDGNGQPKVVQSSTRKAGDVKETRRTVKNGDEEHLSVGHSIGDRTHVIEKKRDKDGRIRQQQKFMNLDADEAEEFNNEFKSRASRNLSNTFGNTNGSRRAIEGDHGRANRRGTTSGTSAPIVTVPDDDDDEVQYVSTRNGRRNGRKREEQDFVYSNKAGGPTIREVSDEDDDMNGSNKRRKGLFGKFI